MVLTLDPKIAMATRELVLALCKMYDIPLRAPRGKDGMALEGDVFHGVMPEDKILSGEFSGVVGHHHVSAPGGLSEKETDEYQPQPADETSIADEEK